ncbi:1-deoxy-D-xylulose-5-phosphate synthase [Desulfuribacillus alkaliarsenatis]|uniref:1-deoxy-D-xylulose-5-phosphate synthase n=1 Tax=Desulfuribacillus alkaliarsenatis TaxID=766136 RepID=A0A1E5G5I5_9FIRM|nr:1-deoxy-D-xylulose-5-phosphate synthase [Desulfuribacillus alkaliarsenatis]OEF98451.1 1-deoxy-D-xylulose-5-phosphate synthase [Desulfuribacillus alkaliarsenatis]
MLLQTINHPTTVKEFNLEQKIQLANEIRTFLIEEVSKTGGHLGPNLGVVELTIALHSVFNSPEDKMIWDVGHQSYVHKILTGRWKQFSTLRCYKGLSGFPKCKESEHDVFETGHSSTSISAALGMAYAAKLNNESNHSIAIIGDGAMTGGIALEALNHAGQSDVNLIVILNDNEMSIAQNVGALSNYLTRMRTDPNYSRVKDDIEFILKKIPAIGSKMLKTAERIKDSLKYLFVSGMLFEELGFTYLGPIDGHNLEDLESTLQQAKRKKGPLLVHVITKKGKGYPPAEKNPDLFHGIGKFDIETGQSIKKQAPPSYTKVFGDTIVAIAADEQKIACITAAMPTGTGLTDFSKKYPERFFDVGIAEQHAVTLAAGLAKGGFIPVFAVYSTFLQRGYDQVLHDVCLQNIPVIFAVDRAGLVGQDGETHHGVFDLAYLRHIPNITIMMPKDENELRHMLYTAVQLKGPVVVRYPRLNGNGVDMSEELACLPIGRMEYINRGQDLSIIALGPMLSIAQDVASRLETRDFTVNILNARFVKPLDEETLDALANLGAPIIIIEEHVLQGGLGSAILEYYEQAGRRNLKIKRYGIPDKFIEHGDRLELLSQIGLTAEQITEEISQFLPLKTQHV